MGDPGHMGDGSRTHGWGFQDTWMVVPEYMAGGSRTHGWWFQNTWMVVPGHKGGGSRTHWVAAQAKGAVGSCP